MRRVTDVKVIAMLLIVVSAIVMAFLAIRTDGLDQRLGFGALFGLLLAIVVAVTPVRP